MSNPSDVHVPVFEFTQELLKYREDAIKAALDNYYGEGKWSEGIIGDSVIINVDENGAETLLIHGMPMIYFSPLRTDVRVIRAEVKCYFCQEIRALYK